MRRWQLFCDYSEMEKCEHPSIVLGLELHSRLAMRKVAYQPKTTWQELVNDSKAGLTTITEKTSGNTPRHDAGFLLRKARPKLLRHLSESWVSVSTTEICNAVFARLPSMNFSNTHMFVRQPEIIINSNKSPKILPNERKVSGCICTEAQIITKQLLKQDYKDIREKRENTWGSSLASFCAPCIYWPRNLILT